MSILTVGMHLAKNEFAVHGRHADGKAVPLHSAEPLAQPLALTASLPPRVMAVAACAGDHHWARGFARLGHTVRLTAPKFVNPSRRTGRRGKNEAADAAAICEAANRPDMLFMPTKSAEQHHQPTGHRARQGSSSRARSPSTASTV